MLWIHLLYTMRNTSEGSTRSARTAAGRLASSERSDTPAPASRKWLNGSLATVAPSKAAANRTSSPVPMPRASAPASRVPPKAVA